MDVTEGMDVVIIGAGQAGLAVAHELAARDIDSVVFERAAVAQSWRNRWDSFTLVTPNWTLNLPGQPYVGTDPEGHVGREEIVDYLERYAAASPATVRERVAVTSLAPSGHRYRLTVDGADVLARTVVVCTGSFREPHRPVAFESTRVPTLDATEYRN